MAAERRSEVFLFDKAMKKVQAYLKPIQLQIDHRDRNKTVWQILRVRWWLLINILWINTDVIAQIAWLVQGVSTGKSFVELTKLAPCLALCFLSDVQLFYFIKHNRQVCELIEAVQTIQLQSEENNLSDADVAFLKKQIKFFHLAINSLRVIIITGIGGFGLNPFLTMATIYQKTGELKLILPFLVSYPFNTNDIRFWPFAYIHEMWSAVIAVLTALAPYYLCYACSTFIIFQFRLLKNNLENIIPYKSSLHVQLMDEDFKRKLMKMIDRHRKLIQCVDRMEFVYAESTLFNVIVSSLLICLTGFNVMAIKDLAVVVPFIQFLLMNLLQIYFLCYYGDMIMIYSMDIGNATYNCQWYRADPEIVKMLMIISLRARKPCKMTALRFSDINFKTFTKILSTSWSYFALLTTLYRK